MLDSVFSTMMSQNTTDKNAHAAVANLKAAHPTWGTVMTAPPSNIAALIRCAGLSEIRTERMQMILNTLSSEQGGTDEPSMEYLRALDNDAVKKELSRFKGIGPKTISCVLLFAMGRGEFPVDTHVLRIAKHCGWVSSSATRESAYNALNSVVPDEIKMDLHCLLVRHGKVCHKCAANGKPQFPPEDGPLVCPLRRCKSVSVKRENEAMTKTTMTTTTTTKKNKKQKKVKMEATKAAEDAAIVKDESDLPESASVVSSLPNKKE